MTCHSDKYASSSRHFVLTGSPNAERGYTLLNINTKDPFISCDIAFVEDVFPYSDTKEESITYVSWVTSDLFDKEDAQDFRKINSQPSDSHNDVEALSDVFTNQHNMFLIEWIRVGHR